MSRRGRMVAALGAAALLIALVPARPGANGVALRELEGRVVAVDAAAGTLVVERQFRGRTTRVTLRAGPTLAVHACGAAPGSLDAVRAGVLVSVFYEAVGAEGVANLVVVEPP